MEPPVLFCTAFGKEVAEKGRGGLGPDPVHHLRFVMALRVLEDARGLQHAPGFRIRRPEDEPRDPRLGDRGGTHRTGFECHVKRVPRQPFRALRRANLAQRQNLGVRRGISQLQNPVPGPGCNPAIGIHDDGPHGHLPARSGRSGLGQSRFHMALKTHADPCPGAPHRSSPDSFNDHPWNTCALTSVTPPDTRQHSDKGTYSMAHANFGQFLEDFHTTWGENVARAGGQPLQAARQGWDYYRTAQVKARTGALKLGLYQNLLPLLGQFQSVFDQPNRGRLFIERPNDQGHWELYYNDCFILGGVHAQAQFELMDANRVMALPELATANQIHNGFNQMDYIGTNAPQWRFKVTQREIMGLNEFGYTSDNANGNVRTFQCQLPPKAGAATLRGYKRMVDDMAAIV